MQVVIVILFIGGIYNTMPIIWYPIIHYDTAYINYDTDTDRSTRSKSMLIFY